LRTEIRQDFQAVPTWEALAYIKGDDRGKDGYLVATFSHAGSLADTMAADVKSVVGVTRDDMQPVIGLEIARWFLTQCATVSWDPTIEALVAQIKANPGKVRYMAQGAGGGVDLGFFSFMKHFGINADQVDAIPIGGTVEQATATAACEGDVTVTTVEPIMPHIQKGRVKLLMMNGTERVPEFPDVPTAADLGMAGGGLMSGKELVTWKDVPATHVAWLYELFRKATSEQSYIDKRKKIPGLVVEIRNPADTQKLFDETVVQVRDVLDQLGLLVVKD
jgi:tripartite-type tricarboxylate transporter receptor subunit TctC